VNQIQLKPDGTLIAETKMISDSPLYLLGHQLQLAENCCLRSFFLLFENYMVFSQLGDFYPLIKDQYDQCPGSGCLWPGFDNLEFSKTVEMIGFPGNPRLEIYHALKGVGLDASHDIRQLPLKVLLDMPLILGPLKHLVFGDRMDTMEFETVYTLFEFIDGMAWALSFHGAPAECMTRS